MKDYADTQHMFVQLPNLLLHTYNLHDSYNTARLAGHLLSELSKPSLRPNLRFYQEWLHPLQPAVVKMQQRGLLVDRKALAETRERYKQELRDTDKLVRQVAKDQGLEDFKPNSDHQVSKLLFDKLGLKVARRTEKTGRPSVDLESLERVLKAFRKMDEPHRPVMENLFHRSRLQTMLDRYLDLPIDDDGRVRARAKMTGTKTWRFAVADPPLHGWPGEVRHTFHAAKGKVLVTIDYSQLEARILAILSGDEPSLKVFAEGGDIHAANARDLFGWGMDQWLSLTPTQRKAARNFAKTFLYGLSYGGSAETMKMKTYCPCPRCVLLVPPTVNLKRDEIKMAELRWLTNHPQVRAFQDRVEHQVRRLHYYESPFGYRFFIGQPWGEELSRRLKNLPMQGSGGLLMNRRQVELDRLDAPILLQHHDSFVFELDDDVSLPARIQAFRDTMEAPLEELGGHSLPCDVAVGHNWGDFDEDNPERNPGGLRKWKLAA